MYFSYLQFWIYNFQVSARIGASSAPFVAKGLKPFGSGVPFIVMGIPALIASACGLYLPETKDAKLMTSTDEVDDTINTVIFNESAEMKTVEQLSWWLLVEATLICVYDSN